MIALYIRHPASELNGPILYTHGPLLSARRCASAALAARVGVCVYRCISLSREPVLCKNGWTDPTLLTRWLSSTYLSYAVSYKKFGYILWKIRVLSCGTFFPELIKKLCHGPSTVAGVVNRRRLLVYYTDLHSCVQRYGRNAAKTYDPLCSRWCFFLNVEFSVLTWNFVILLDKSRPHPYRAPNWKQTDGQKNGQKDATDCFTLAANAVGNYFQQACAYRFIQSVRHFQVHSKGAF